MEVAHKYPINIKQWIHADINQFMGSNSESEPIHGFGISQEDPQNPGHFYFNVGIEKTIDNSDNGRVFHGQTLSTFLVRLDADETPTVEFYFGLTEEATQEFANIFHERTQNTNLLNRKTPVPQIEDFREDIQRCIDVWSRTRRNNSLN